MPSSLTSAHRTAALHANAEYIDQLYEVFKTSPDKLSAEWRNYFYGFEHGMDDARSGAGRTAPPQRQATEPHAAAERLVAAYRLLGHLVADLDPLALAERPRPPELTPEYYGLDEAALELAMPLISIDPDQARPLREILAILEKVYCGTLASEHMHIAAPDERRWLEQRLESTHGDWRGQHGAEVRRDILKDLTAAEGLEQYLHKRYVGQKRFSLEGADSLIPLLDELVQGAGQRGVTDIVLAMAHRGRLNVLVNLLGKAPQDLFDEFDGNTVIDEQTGSGDVKYHQGFYSDIQTPGGPVHLSLAFNPSHLELVGPVVEGGVRARQDRHEGDARNQVIPVWIHGDAAFIGQGVVTETLNLAKTPAYSTGGTLHVVVNNQIGFTTSDPQQARSTHYCTEVAKLVQAPILHVNGDDPDAVVFAMQLALDYRLEFQNDIVIDLICYRRHGHNEADEPALTQPWMYRKIRQLPTTRALYAKRLIAEGLVSFQEEEQFIGQYREALAHGQVVVREFLHGSHSGYQAIWDRFLDADPNEQVITRVPHETLVDVGNKALSHPEDFKLHRVISRVMGDRQRMLNGEIPLDWGMAEILAYATMLHDGHAIRLSGQDSQRGTFAHRHAVLHDQDSRRMHTPLLHIAPDQPRFEVINSVLSEVAALAFEYGYATSSPDSLVIWEAQFGDFANVAQPIIDQFIASGYLKWGRLCQLTLFLPHGFEGQGPEHSSARLERFLQLSAQLNMRVWSPTTPAQFFHLLRDQIKRGFRRPLIVMTPKSLLRHPLAKSELGAFTDGALAVIQPDPDPIEATTTRRIVLCSGKVFYDLLSARREREIRDIVIIRIEQLYPFPRRRLARLLEAYANASELVWCQEEPRNQGAWYQIQHHLRVLKRPHQTLGLAGRAPSASPACGYAKLHAAQQDELIERALSGQPVDDPGERLEDRDTRFKDV